MICLDVETGSDPITQTSATENSQCCHLVIEANGVSVYAVPPDGKQLSRDPESTESSLLNIERQRCV